MPRPASTVRGAVRADESTPRGHSLPPTQEPTPQPDTAALHPDTAALLEGTEQLVIVRALPGMGKTRLLAVWRERCAVRGLDVGYASARDLRSPLADVLAGERSTGRYRATVIDDAELLSAAHVDEIIAALLADPALRVVLGTSCATAPVLPAVCPALSMRELGASHLKMTAQGLPAAVAGWGSALDAPAYLSRLLLATDGWPGLARQLVLASTDGPGAAVAAGPTVADALATPAVSTWLRAAVERALGGAELLSLVRRLALAPLILEPHIDLLEVGDDMLARLGSLGFFAQTGAAGPLRLVPAIRTLLREDARSRYPAEFAHWNRVFAEGLVSHGGRDEIWVALEHARAAGAWDILSRLWSAHGLGLLNRNFTVAVAAYSDLPTEALHGYPALHLAQLVLTSLDSAGSTTGTIWLRASTQGAAPLLSQMTASTTADGLIGVMSAVLVHQRVTGSVAGALETSQVLEQQLEQRAARGDRPSASNSAWARFQHAVSLLLADDVTGSIAAATDAYEWAVGAGVDAEHVVVNAAAHLALCAALSGSERTALDWLDALGPDDPSQWHRALTRVPAQIAAASVATEQLDRAGAEQAVAVMGDGSASIEMWPFVAAQAARTALTFGDPAVMRAEFDQVERSQALLGRARSNGATLRLARARADGLIATGDAGRAVDLLETVAHRVCAAKPEAVPELLVPYARAHLYGGRAAKAARLAAKAMHSRRTAHIDAVEAMLILAEASLRQSDRESAVEAFGRAHALAVHRQHWRVFLGIPRESLALLAAASGVELPAHAVERIAGLGPLFTESELIAELTARELVVLDGLSSGGSTAEIAAGLSVSPNTVKSQIASIFAKLGVNDRERALIVAERRGLVRRRP